MPAEPAEKNGPQLTMGSLAVSPPLLLAPMAGITHSVFRTVVKRLGGVGLLSTEMLSARIQNRIDFAVFGHDVFFLRRIRRERYRATE